MFNLLRMDLYRMRRSRSAYVCLGILFLTTLASYILLWLLATPQGQETAIRIGMMTAEETQESLRMLEGMDTLTMFRNINLDGGAYCITFGIWVILFVCMDYRSGFLKNIMALYQNRWVYVGSKLLAAALLNILYLISNFLFVVLLNALFGNMVPQAGLGDVLFYMAWAWILTTAFGGLMLLICVCTRSTAAGTFAAVLLGGGSVVSMVQGILSMFHAGDWLNYSIYMMLSNGPSRYTGLQDLKVFAVGAGFLVLYSALAGWIMKKQDI